MLVTLGAHAQKMRLIGENGEKYFKISDTLTRNVGINGVDKKVSMQRIVPSHDGNILVLYEKGKVWMLGHPQAASIVISDNIRNGEEKELNGFFEWTSIVNFIREGLKFPRLTIVVFPIDHKALKGEKLFDAIADKSIRITKCIYFQLFL